MRVYKIRKKFFMTKNYLRQRRKAFQSFLRDIYHMVGTTPDPVFIRESGKTILRKRNKSVIMDMIQDIYFQEGCQSLTLDVLFRDAQELLSDEELEYLAKTNFFFLNYTFPKEVTERETLKKDPKQAKLVASFQQLLDDSHLYAKVSALAEIEELLKTKKTKEERELFSLGRWYYFKELEKVIDSLSWKAEQNKTSLNELIALYETEVLSRDQELEQVMKNHSFFSQYQQ